MKLAIVHDFLTQMGGAEQVVKIFREIFPDAPVYTSIYNPKVMCPSFKTADIRTSFMQKLPFAKNHSRRYLPLYPYAFESFDLSEYDVVLSSSSSFAKGVITGPHTCHICYCYTPMRFVWNYHTYIEQEPFSRLTRSVLPYVIHQLRRWDEITTNRVDHFIANSSEIDKRIRKYYRRPSTIIHSPVDMSRFSVGERDGGYYLIVSRMLPYKRIDIAIQACNKLRVPLKVVGNGRDMERLKGMAGPTVEMLGRVSDEERLKLLRECKALLFPGTEDFGLVPVEAMACGKPVIAYAGGGALDTVRVGVSGVFFNEQTPESLADAIMDFDSTRFDPQAIREHAELFDVNVFKEQILSFVRQKCSEYSKPPVPENVESFGILARVDGRKQPESMTLPSTTEKSPVTSDQ